uniref:Uncharacterized protein n=1 Tax=Panagrolaimus sp. JU765 TaxID=591449 RepID=A0AC34QFI7_9BILA
MCINGFKIDESKNAIVCVKTNQVVMENIVFNLVGIFAFVYDIRKEEIREINNFVEFNHFELVFEIGIQQRFPQLFTSNVKTVGFYDGSSQFTEINYDNFNIDPVLQLLPNVEKIKFYEFEVSKLFVRINRDFGPKLAEVYFEFYFNAVNYGLLAEVMRKQSSNACFYVYCWGYSSEAYMKKLLLHFEPVAEPVSNCVAFALKNYSGYPATQYFVLRDFPEVPDPGHNANHSIPTSYLI